MLKVLILFALCAVITNGNVLRTKRLAEIQNDLELYASVHIREFQLARTSLHLECYDVYIPEISRIAEEGKNASQRCIDSADLNKKIVESQTIDETETIISNVAKLQQALNVCQNKSDIINYLECHVGSAEEYKALVEGISSTSQQLLAKLKGEYNAIESEENKCIDTAVNDAKVKTDDVFNNLQFCLTHGLPTPSPVETTQTVPVETTTEAVITTNPESTILETTTATEDLGGLTILDFSSL